MRIVKLIPYYGQWPDYMHIYLKSCSRNPILSVVFITDLEPFPDSPENVRYVRLTFEELKERITQTFGIDVSSIEPYKLCDFRPAYGLLFSDIIGGADFWAYGDNDLIYGDLAKFITDELLIKHDVLSFKKGHLQGPFTIYRNNAVVNNLFRDDSQYSHIFANPKYLSFDEFGPSCFYTTLSTPEEVSDLPSDNISVIAFKRQLAGELAVFNEQLGKENLQHDDVVVYEDGRLTNFANAEEYLFYHWVLEKRATWFRYPTWFSTRPKKYFVSVTGFYSPPEFQFFDLLHNWRLTTGLSRWFVLKCANFLKRRVGIRVAIDTCPRIGWVKSLPAPPS